MSKKVIAGICVAIILILLVVGLIVIKPWQDNKPQNTPESTQTQKTDETNTNTELPEEEFEIPINSPGDFELKVPQVMVLDKAKEKYEKTTIGMDFDKLKDELGEPSETDSYRVITYYSWKLDDAGYIKLRVSVKNEQSKVIEKALLLFSNPTLGYKLSSELGTEIQDLPSEMEKVEEGMTLNEVIEILGDKFIEQSRNEKNYKIYVWYDVNENSVELTFSSDNILVEKLLATYKG